MSTPSTNVRLTPGFYLAVKHLSELMHLPMGNAAGLLMMSTFQDKKVLESFPIEIQQAIGADALSILGDLLKVISTASLQNTSIADLYKTLLKSV